MLRVILCFFNRVNILWMQQQLRTYLVAAGVLTGFYALYNYMNHSHKSLDLKLTQKIAQEIKHQMMIVSINFADGIAKHATGPSGVKINDDKINEYFIDELGKIYKQKEDLILSKYSVKPEIYKNSLDRHARDKKLVATLAEINDMMSRAVKGIVPDLTVPQEVKLCSYLGILCFQQGGYQENLQEHVHLNRQESFRKAAGRKTEEPLLRLQ